MESLEGKVAIVTGGANSIGAVIVREFSEAGTDVMIADIDEESGKATSDEIGDSVRFTKTDVSDPDDCRNLVDRTVEKFGGVDYLINNAVTYEDGGYDADFDTWVNGFSVNTIGGIILMKACHPIMKDRGGGSVVFMSSISGHRAQPGRWVYNATKAANIQVTRSAALDLADDGIRVNCIAPGWTWSDPLEGLSGGDKEKYNEEWGQFHMLGRCGEPEEIAQAIKFLCSDQASFITGAELPVDGGYLGVSGEGTEPVVDM